MSQGPPPLRRSGGDNVSSRSPDSGRGSPGAKAMPRNRMRSQTLPPSSAVQVLPPRSKPLPPASGGGSPSPSLPPQTRMPHPTNHQPEQQQEEERSPNRSLVRRSPPSRPAQRHESQSVESNGKGVAFSPAHVSGWDHNGVSEKSVKPSSASPYSSPDGGRGSPGAKAMPRNRMRSQTLPPSSAVQVLPPRNKPGPPATGGGSPSPSLPPSQSRMPHPTNHQPEQQQEEEERSPNRSTLKQSPPSRPVRRQGSLVLDHEKQSEPKPKASPPPASRPKPRPVNDRDANVTTTESLPVSRDAARETTVESRVESNSGGQEIAVTPPTPLNEQQDAAPPKTNATPDSKQRAVVAKTEASSFLSSASASAALQMNNKREPASSVATWSSWVPREYVDATATSAPTPPGREANVPRPRVGYDEFWRSELTPRRLTEQVQLIDSRQQLEQLRQQREEQRGETLSAGQLVALLARRVADSVALLFGVNRYGGETPTGQETVGVEVFHILCILAVVACGWYWLAHL